MILGVPLKAPPVSRASSSRPFPLLVTHPFSQALGRGWHFIGPLRSLTSAAATGTHGGCVNIYTRREAWSAVFFIS